MIKYLFFILMFSLSHTGYAQKNTGVIKGSVTSADGSPAYVTVELKKYKKATVTDKSGIFKFLNLPALEDTLVISSVESQVLSRAIAVEKDGTIDIGNIRLASNIARLQDVEVTGRIAHSYKSDYTFLGTRTQTAYIDIPQSISTITKEMIADKMEFTLKDAADEAAGVSHYSGYDDYSIRGFKAENARLINGLRGYNTTYTSAMLVNVERIEVVKGPTATLYGNCDPGGTINLVTKKPLENKQGEINVYRGTWNHSRVQGDITGPVNKSKTLLYRFNAGYDNTASFRDIVVSKSYELAPSLSFIPNQKIKLNIDFSLSHINTVLDRGQPGYRNDFSLMSTPVNLIASQPGNFLHETDLATSLLFSYRINNYITFNSGYLNYITDQNTAEHGIKSFITDDSVNLYYTDWKYHTTTHTFTDYFTFSFNTGKFSHQFLAGYDYIKSDVDLDQKYYEQANLFGTGSGIVETFSLKHPKNIGRPIEKYQRSAYNADASDVEATVYSTQGFYVQDQVSLGKWNLLLGLRQELYEAEEEADSTALPGEDEDDIAALLPRVGLVYKLNAAASLYATYNKGFDPFEASTSTQIFDEPFKPVTNQLLEAGVKLNLFRNKLSASVSLYQLTLQNVAVNANDMSNPNLYKQQGEDRARGIETEVNGNIFPNLALSANYSYCVARVIKSITSTEEGTLVENAPIHSSNSWIRYTFNKGLFKGFGLAAGHSQAGKRNTLTPGLILPAYFVVNAGARYSYKHFNAALNVTNITDKVYWIGGYNVVNKWLGSPRSIMISAAYSF